MEYFSLINYKFRLISFFIVFCSYFKYLAGVEKPKTWFCTLGTNDLRNVRESEMFQRRQLYLDGFLDFFGQLRKFSPSSKVVWVSIGHARKSDRSYATFKVFENFVNAKKATFPSWLEFKDITWDCSDSNIKDEFGHWNNDYMKTVARRLSMCVLQRFSEGKTFLYELIISINNATNSITIL